jgi:predicted transcriptional regulator
MATESLPLFDHPAVSQQRRSTDAEPDITRNFHGGNPQSKAAHQSVQADAASLRVAVWKFLQKIGPATCDEVEAGMALSHQTCSARFTELKRDEWIFPTGKTRATRSGRQAMTFIAGVEVR